MIHRFKATVVTASMAATAIIVWLTSTGSALEYRVPEILQGGWWRIATSHLTHWSGTHVLWDAGTMVLLGVVYDRLDGSTRRLLLGLGASVVAIPSVLLVLQPELTAYRGLSGLASMMFVLVAMRAMRQSIDLVEKAVIGFAAKLLAETVTGTPLFATDLGTGVVAVPLAHITGAAIGLLAGISVRWSTGTRAYAQPKSRPINS